MNIISITVIIRHSGADKIYLQTDLPYACHPFDGTQGFTCEAARGTGVDYVKKHFNIEPKVIEEG